jgi:hypothetical protein
VIDDLRNITHHDISLTIGFSRHIIKIITIIAVGLKIAKDSRSLKLFNPTSLSFCYCHLPIFIEIHCLGNIKPKTFMPQ